MEWMIIVVSLAAPQDDRTGASYPVVQMERFATEAECDRAGKAVKSMAASLGNGAETMIQVRCGEVEPIVNGR